MNRRRPAPTTFAGSPGLGGMLLLEVRVESGIAVVLFAASQDRGLARQDAAW